MVREFVEPIFYHCQHVPSIIGKIPIEDKTANLGRLETSGALADEPCALNKTQAIANVE